MSQKNGFNNCPTCGSNLDTFELSKINQKETEKFQKLRGSVVWKTMDSIKKIQVFTGGAGITRDELRSKLEIGKEYFEIIISDLKEMGLLDECGIKLVWKI